SRFEMTLRQDDIQSCGGTLLYPAQAPTKTERGSSCMNGEMIVSVMTQKEVEMAVDWAAAEGWNPGFQDAASFHALDPNGFFLGLLHGRPVGCISAVAYDEHFGFIGLHIVKPEYRAKGHGMQIFRAGMNYLGKRTIGLNAVLAQQSNYE